MTVARFVTAILLLTPLAVSAQAILRSVNEPETPPPSTFVAPFILYSEATRFGGGLGASSEGHFQPQLFMGAAAFGSTNGSVGFYGMLRDLRLGDQSRLFIDSDLFLTQFAQQQEFVDGNPLFPGHAGSNDSDKRDFVVSDTFSGIINPTLKYVLPIGGARDSPIANYALDRGMIASGATGGWAFNPLTSGRTFIEIQPFASFRRLNFQNGNVPTRSNYDSFGLRAGIRWDNTDLPLNPARGNIASFYVSRDPGIFDSASTYTDLEASYTQFVNLGAIKGFRQSVLAIDLWANDECAGSAPYYMGATLGGYNRLRAYPFNRFSGGAALYAAAELRMIPNWNPVKAWAALDRAARVDWFQLAFFVEAGQVASSLSNELFDNPHIDGGFGLRILAHQVLLRADVAASNEGVTMWLMVGQAF